MEMPGEDTGWETLVEDYGVFHIAMMQADPRTKGLSGGFAQRQKALEDKALAFKAAERAKTTAEALLSYADMKTDEAVRDLYFRKLGACGNNKSNPGFKKWFPGGLTEVVRVGFEEEAGKVQSLMLVLQETPEDPLASEFLQRLAELFDSYQKALQALQDKITVWDNARALVKAEKVNWLAAYKKDYADILSVFEGAASSADSFFKKAARKGPKRSSEAAKPEKA